jgi:flagellar hook-basal body complex protein FliE
MPIELLGVIGAGATGPAMRPAGVASPSGEGEDGFAASLGRLIEGVEKTAGQANVAVSNMLDKSGDVHDAMIALQRAEMTFQLTVQVRNKLVQAYNEIMRMPI